MVERQPFSRIGATALFTMLVHTFLTAIIGNIINTISPELMENAWVQIASSMLPLFLIAYPAGALFMKTETNTGNKVPTGKGKISASKILLLVISAYGLASLTNYLGYGATYLIGKLSGAELQPNPLQGLSEGGSPLAVIVFTVILVPIFEELFFRKVVYSKMSDYGDKAYIIFSAVIFGLFHGNIFQSIYAFFIGLILAYVYVYTGKIIYSIIIHFLMNFIGMGVSSVMIAIGENAVMIWGFIAMALGVAGIIIFFKWTRKQAKLVPLEEGTKSINKTGEMFKNAGFILFAIFIGVIMIVTLLSPMMEAAAK